MIYDGIINKPHIEELLCHFNQNHDPRNGQFTTGSGGNQTFSDSKPKKSIKTYMKNSIKATKQIYDDYTFKEMRDIVKKQRKKDRNRIKKYGYFNYWKSAMKEAKQLRNKLATTNSEKLKLTEREVYILLVSSAQQSSSASRQAASLGASGGTNPYLFG